MANEQVKERNVDCALQNAYMLFIENGIDQTTIEMLARASGISRSSLDRYFCSKLDLVLQTAKWVGDNVTNQNTRIQEIPKMSGLTGLELLKTYMQILQDLLYQNPKLFVLFVELRAFVFRRSSKCPSAPKMLKSYLGSTLLLEKIFERGMEDGSIKSNLNAHAEAIMTRESTLGFFSSIAMSSEQALLNDHIIADLFIDRTIRQYQSG